MISQNKISWKQQLVEKDRKLIELGRKEMKDEIIELILSIFDGKIHKSPTEKTDLIKLIKEPK